jgi:hypothetical protein
LVLFGAAAGVLAYVFAHTGEAWNAVGVVIGCYGVLLAIAIFAWTLGEFAQRRSAWQRQGALRFAEEIGRSDYGGGDLAPWHIRELARGLQVPEAEVENELLAWVIQSHNSQGGKTALVITRSMRFLRVSSRGRGGHTIKDLATDERLRLS